MTEFDKAFDAYVRQYEDTDFDAYVGPEFIFPAGMFEALAWNRVRLPGVHLPDDKSFQFVEAEYMKAEEYDEYLDDPSDWICASTCPGSLPGSSRWRSCRRSATWSCSTRACPTLSWPRPRTPAWSTP